MFANMLVKDHIVTPLFVFTNAKASDSCFKRSAELDARVEGLVNH
jgi:hypothetical protein